MAENTHESTLKKCVDDLVAAANALKNATKPATNSTKSSTAPPLEEHKRLFNFAPRSSAARGAAGGRTSWFGKRKSSAASAPFVKSRSRETWTHKFFLLAMRHTDAVPSTAEKVKHGLAGLGERDLIFNKNGGPQDVSSTIETAFPKLKGIGGYEILRTCASSSKVLEVIRMPVDGYSVPFLKACLLQAKGYIRPIQKNLSLEPMASSSGVSEDSTTPAPKEECLFCKKLVPLYCLREHSELCQEQEKDDSDDNEDSSKTSKYKDEDVVDLTCTFTDDKCSTVTSKEKADNRNATREVLSTLFPNVPETTIQAVVDTTKDVDDAVNVMLDTEVETVQFDKPSCSSFVEMNTIDKGQPLTLKSLMASQRTQLNEDDSNRATIDRESLWSDSVILFKSSKFKPCHPLRIRFFGEAGLDAGGLSREYARLLKHTLFSTEAKLFEGPADRRLPIYNGDALHSNLFVLAGKMCSYLITHYDVGIPCLAPCVYEYLSTGDIEKASQKCSLEDIPDLDLQEMIKEVNNASTKDELEKAASPMFTNACLSAGWVKMVTLENKGLATWQLVVHETLIKRKAPLDHFVKGLNLLNLLQTVRSHPNLMSSYFVSNKERRLTKEKVINLFDNINGKQEQQDDERAREFLLRSIDDLSKDQGQEGLEKFLKFLTGLDEEPPLGFSHLISIEFHPDDRPTLFAETCLMTLGVPTVHKSYESFKGQFMMACDFANTGFGSV